MTDSIIEEIHIAREEYAENFDFDVDAILEDLRQKQSNGSRKIVSFAKDKKEKRDSGEKKVA